MVKTVMMMGMLIAAMVSVLAVGKAGQEEAVIDVTKTTPVPHFIHGQVLYQERVALPQQAQALLIVDLIDITEMDTARKIVAQTFVKIENPPPIPFTLPLMRTNLEVDHVYALQARISVGDVLWFANARPLPVTLERDGYLIRLEPVGFSIDPLKSSLKGSEWLAERIEGNATIEPFPSLIIENVNHEEDDMAGEHSSSTFRTRYKVSGAGGCNRYFSTALLDEEKNQIQFSPLGMTFMACLDAIMHQESRFVDMMSRVRSYQIEEDERLYLMDEKNEIIARFKTRF